MEQENIPDPCPPDEIEEPEDPIIEEEISEDEIEWNEYGSEEEYGNL